MARLSVEVAARRWEHGWELHVSDGRGPLVVLALPHQHAQPVEVRITVTFGTDLDEEITAVRAALDHAERAQRGAAARSRALALRLREAGLTGADIAVVLRVSPQRVSQLMRTTGC